MNGMKRVVLLNRVSTSTQSTERQLRDLTEVCDSKSWNIVNVFDEVGSGYKTNEDREVLNQMIDYCKTNKVDMIVVSELSRLGRKTSEVLSLINKLNDNEISLYIQMNNIETLDDDKKPNPLTMFMLSILSSVNNMEKSITLDRMNSGRENYIKNGGKIGRKVGSTISKEDKLKQHQDVIEYLNKGYKYDDIVKLTGKSLSTIQRVKKLVNNVSLI
jgi:DNA invertase Pin-like site-specific DNA recombinase